ncbi:hypothetical protein [Bradyrhizobium sp. B117]|uniref:hypothetical protein n=1 Tax=Bradyrhizobium sp. B117 TaxID=3140246 RepID=UPI0031830E4F
MPALALLGAGLFADADDQRSGCADHRLLAARRTPAAESHVSASASPERSKDGEADPDANPEARIGSLEQFGRVATDYNETLPAFFNGIEPSAKLRRV